VSIGVTGIWVMHFIAMLGFTIPGQTITYNVPVTIGSMLIAVGVVGIGLFIVGFGGRGPAPLHYTGMAALHVRAAPGGGMASMGGARGTAGTPIAASLTWLPPRPRRPVVPSQPGKFAHSDLPFMAR
jgi:NO-binding membrane sensor protein with MHYT domain